MTLDEAIRIEKDTARRSENHLEYNRIHQGHEYEIAACDCEQSMIYHRQLAEWLTDYKKLKEKEELKRPIINKGFVLCPSCDICIRYPIADKYTHCPYCGQALKWEEEE